MFNNKNYYTNIVIYLFLLFSLIILIIIKVPGLKGNIDQELRILTKEPLIIDKRFPIKQSIYNIKIVLADLLSFKKKDFETLAIEMKFKDLDKLKKDRSKSLKKGILENPSKINLDIKWKGKKFRSSGRLKGDFNDHRNLAKQWSMKFNLKNSENLDGMTEFSITNHQSRQFPFNFIISKNLERMGLHVPKFRTVNVNFNGYDWGIMLIEEQFSKEFLENRKLKDTLIFKLSDEAKIKFLVKYYNKGILDNSDYRILTKWQDKFNVNYQNQKKIFKKEETFETKDFLKKHTLMKSVNEKMNTFNENSLNDIVEKYFDLKSFATMFVSSLAWGEKNFHSMELHNVRFYINPYTLKITPIPADFDFIFQNGDKNLNLLKNDNFLKILISDMLTLPTFYHAIFANKKFQNLYIEQINAFEKNLENIIIDADKVCLDFSEICNNSLNLNQLKNNLIQLKLIKKNLFDVFFIKIKEIKEVEGNNLLVYDGSDYIKYTKKNNLNKASYFEMYDKHIYARLFEDGNLEISNLTSTNFYINSVNIEKIDYKKKLDLEVQGSSFNKINNLKLNLDIKPKLNSIVKLNYSFKRNENFLIYETLVERNIDLMEKNTLAYNFEDNKILKNDNNIIFENKKYIINKPLIIPKNYNLIILEGANLLFSKNAYILVHSGSLKILGTNIDKVILSALDDKWGGIHVIGDNKNSLINHAIISKLNHFENNKFSLTGAINFYQSNVKINNSIFKMFNSEDSINFVKSNFYINNSIFSKTKSDGLDSDYSVGNIVNTKFIDIGGDAIDTSGSNVKISETEIFNVGDKGISVGENSVVNLSNILINNSKIGIASKDNSEVLGNNISIKNSRSHDLASYNKKKIFEGGTINLTNVISDNKYLSQINSIIKINNKKIIEKDFKTKDLY